MEQERKSWIASRSPYFWYNIFAGLIVLGLIYSIGTIIVTIVSDRGAVWRQLGAGVNIPKPFDVEPTRGAIYSGDDRPIAVSAPTYHLYIDFGAEVLQDLRKEAPDSASRAKRNLLSDSLSGELDKLANALEEVLASDGVKVNKRELRDRWRKAFAKKARYHQLIPQELSYLQYKRLCSIDPMCLQPNEKGQRVNKSLIQKMMSPPKGRVKRIKPFGSLASRTIGSLYAEPDSITTLSRGNSGIELYANEWLRGQMGKGTKVFTAGRWVQRVLKSQVDGASVYTTLDMNKQSQLERIMRKQLEYYSAQSGTAVLMEVQTGRILAITNLGRATNGQYYEVQNFAVSDMSDPGSTFKVASMLVALNDKVVSPSDTIDVGNGRWVVAKRTITDHNAHRGGYGRITVAQTIERSSNVGVAKIIQQHYAQRPDDYINKIKRMGFGQKMTLEIPGVGTPRLPDPASNHWYGTTLAWMSYGYETGIPPIYTLAFFNAIANGGRYMEPYLVREIRSTDGEVLLHREPTARIEQIASPEAIKQIQEMLYGVVHAKVSTGSRALSPTVSISGKTGTAQLVKGGRYSAQHHQVSFCGYFPSEAPRYSIIVVLREPSSEFPAGGGAMAAPVVRELAESIISMETPMSLDSIRLRQGHEHIRIDAGSLSRVRAVSRIVGLKLREPSGLDSLSLVTVSSEGVVKPLPATPKGAVPYVVGMSADEAHYQLLKAGYKVHLEGHGRVAEQSLPYAANAPRGTTITLQLRP